MPTQKLYEEQPDLMTFTATVLDCFPAGSQFGVILDRTAFFPEGGGQGADHGTLGTSQVLDVHLRQGEIVHTLDRALPVGAEVTGSLDTRRRLAMMQHHTGEHIFSGITCRRFSCSNVGFHIGSDLVTMDFNAMMTLEDALETEHMANAVIWQDLPVRCWYPSPEELEHVSYRSKKEIDGPLRLVSIEGADTCACCGTHVSSTGRVGQIKVMAFQHYKQGVRISILCGERALEAENAMFAEQARIRHLLSAKDGTLADSVEHLLRERDELRYAHTAMALELFEARAEALRNESIRVLVCDLPSAQLRPCAGRLAEGAEAAAILVPRGSGWSIALCSASADMRPIAASLFSAFGGRGGGSADMVQGMLEKAQPDEVRDMLASLLNGTHTL